DHGGSGGVLRRDRTGHLHRLRPGAAAGVASLARARMGRRGAALGRPPANLVDGRSHAPRDSGRAGQDRGARDGHARYRHVRHRGTRAAAAGNPAHAGCRCAVAAGALGQCTQSDQPRPVELRAGVLTVNAAPATASRFGLVTCESCELLLRPAEAQEAGYCSRCGEKLEFRREGSLERTWAFLIGAAICFIPANALPVLNTTTLGSTDGDTILGGIVFLYTSGSWPLAVV